MKPITRVLFLVAASFIWVAGASADNIISYGTGAPTPSGAINTSVIFGGYNPLVDNSSSAATLATLNGGSGPTMNIGTGGIWANPIGSSSWVGMNGETIAGHTYSNTAPSTNNYPPNGTYTYYTLFSATAGDTLTISVMADDTTSVWLYNGVTFTEFGTAAPDTLADEGGHCTTALPNCGGPDTFTTSAFTTTGQYALIFGVDQDFDNATGLDFSGTLAPAPEPSSLLLLGTGLIGAAGALRRRIRG